MLHNLKVHARALFYEKKEMHQVCKCVPVGAACAGKVTPGIFLHFFFSQISEFFLGNYDYYIGGAFVFIGTCCRASKHVYLDMLTEMAVFVMAFLIFVSKRVGGFTYTAYVPVNIAATHEITVATCARFS